MGTLMCDGLTNYFAAKNYVLLRAHLNQQSASLIENVVLFSKTEVKHLKDGKKFLLLEMYVWYFLPRFETNLLKCNDFT